MRKYAQWTALFGVCWWIVLVPKHYYLFSYLTQPIQTVVFQLNDRLFGALPYREDSSGMYLLIAISVIFGALSSLVLFLLPKLRNVSYRPQNALMIILRYYVVLELWEYGWIKVTKMQFYLPEPNIVYTDLGFLSKDIAYWSVMGSSTTYVMFMGIVELLAGALIVIKRTRFVGLLLALGIFIHVVMVNISFDISVKLFSLSLLVFTGILLTQYPNYWRVLFQFPVKPTLIPLPKETVYRRWGRALILSFFLVEAVYPSVMSGHMNDDLVPRPIYHGAYRVSSPSTIAFVYFHRQDYVIFENYYKEKFSYKIVERNNATWKLLDEEKNEVSRLIIHPSGSDLRINWFVENSQEMVTITKIPYRQLPLLKSSFHWFSDSYH